MLYRSLDNIQAGNRQPTFYFKANQFNGISELQVSEKNHQISVVQIPTGMNWKTPLIDFNPL